MLYQLILPLLGKNGQHVNIALTQLDLCNKTDMPISHMLW